MDFLIRHKIIVLLIGLGIAGFAWYSMTAPSSTALLTTDSPLNGPDQELVETLLALRSVKLDGTIFSEGAFTQLQDYSTPIIPEPIGRDNPFAPLTTAPTENTTKDAKIFSPGAKPPTKH